MTDRMPEGTQYVVTITDKGTIQLDKLNSPQFTICSLAFTVQQAKPLVDALNAAIAVLQSHPQFAPRYIARGPHA